MFDPSAYRIADRDVERSLVRWTTVIYGLHAFSIVTGILGAATVIAGTGVTS